MGSRTGRAVGRVIALVVLVVVGVAAVFAYQQRQDIADFFAAQRFTPSAEILALTERIAPTPAGERVFFASHPTLDGSQTFNDQCAQVDHSEEGHVLGCFSGGRIHLFDVADERLTGIVEVTAAHELLHAAFSRFAPEERDDLVRRLQATYDELSASNPDLVERMRVYEGLSPTAFANELHSVLGTEVRDLPAWLEQHYARWFADRSLIVGYFDAYHHIFVELRQEADALQAQLDALRADIEARRVVYDDAVAQYNADWRVFVARNEAFEFSGNPGEFYALRATFESRRAALNAELAELNADIATYEQLRLELEQLGALNNELQSNLNSELAPPAAAPAE